MEIFVGNLPFDVTEQDIREKFAECGEVSNIKMLFDKMSGRFRGIAFVTFDDESQAKNAVANLSGADFWGRPMRIDFSRGIERRFNGFGGGFAPRKKFFKNNNRDFSRPNGKFADKNFADDYREGDGGNDANQENDAREGGNSGGFFRKPFFKKRPFKPFGVFKKFMGGDDENSANGEGEARADSFEEGKRQFRQNRGGFNPKFRGGFKGNFKGGYNKGSFKRKSGFNRDFRRADNSENGGFRQDNSFRSRDDFGDE